MSAAERLLSRLSNAKQTSPGRWMCRCPAHQDSTPSLSVRELEDGRVLLHCFAGCPNGDVLTAIGLRMSDLFDGPIANHLPPIRGGFSARELLALSAHEATVVALLASDAQDRPLTDAERARLAQAAARLSKARELAGGG